MAAEEKVSILELKHHEADPSTVGLASFGIGLFTLSFINIGMLGPNAVSIMIPLAFFVGIIHFFATATGFRKNELFTALVFAIYGMFWMTFCFINLGVVLKWFVLDADALRIFLIAYTIFTAYILIASFVTNVAVIITVALLLVVFLLLDFGQAVWAGYFGILDSLMALYISAAGIINTLYGKTVLPVGPVS
jgi:succinate-acetate transporter protein